MTIRRTPAIPCLMAGMWLAATYVNGMAAIYPYGAVAPAAAVYQAARRWL